MCDYEDTQVKLKEAARIRLLYYLEPEEQVWQHMFCVKRESKKISSVPKEGDRTSALLFHKAVNSGQ